jgi:adenylosuccinate lyase
VIERYTLPEMGKIWSSQSRFQCLLDVEIAVAKAQAKLKIIPPKAAKAISDRGGFNIERIKEIEKVTKHDVIAFVSNVAEKVGELGRYVHYGLTSSDVLDTAVSLQISRSYECLDEKLAALEKALKDLSIKHKNTITAGRTHGMHAEPTTFGFKVSGFLMELKRNRVRLRVACEQACRVKLSGAVGTYSALGPEVEKEVAAKLGFPVEDIATQVIPRDRHAQFFSSLALLGSGFERLAVEIRHLQRTEVGEAEEPFEKGQKGSSAMPHKRNPIASENITGLARLLRGYMVAAFENVALWHERDISHSSVERVIFPDAFIIADYATHRLTQVVKGLQVDKARMKENLGITRGQIMSSHILLELVKAGFSREEAYAVVQKQAHSLKNGQTLESSILSDPELKKILKKSSLKNIFSGESYRKNLEPIMKRAIK